MLALTKKLLLDRSGNSGRKKYRLTLTLLDQIIVSSTRFVTIIVIGRISGAHQLGEFSLAFQLSVLLIAVQEALILTPYTLFVNRFKRGKARAEFAGSVLMHSIALTLFTMLCLALLATGLSIGNRDNNLSNSIWILMCIMPFITLREFGRRFAFADLRVKTALLVDLVMAITQIGGLILLTVTGSLSAAAALWVMGIAAALPGIGWLIHDHRRFSFNFSRMVPAWRENWLSGRWVLGISTVSASINASLYWLLALISGLAATGVFAACMTMVQLANPVLLGLGNFLKPLMARAFFHGGYVKLLDIINQVQLKLGVSMAMFCVLLSFLGADAVALIYHGPEYAGHHHMMVVLACNLLIGSLTLAPGLGMQVLEKSDVIFAVRLLEAAILFILLVGFVHSYGMLAIAYALLITSFITAMLLSLALYRNTGPPTANKIGKGLGMNEQSP